MSTFNERLKKLRKNKRLTQKELAEHIEVVQSKISSWETEKLEPNLYRLIQLADYFGVTTDYLLGREEEKS
ncbi:helix-turn-helix domain-containing protein [Lactococcus garvieae]|uniref:Helix-turn-helix domain-containing protein n=1 Tax=Lactococcus garvieae TaxID=1363 RepID=A0AA46YR86_9LACT|nr:helix-turn-helix transcriptional regulator [Lactococcus garvieae]UYT10242.1 helix-turn-helix domain-containing protein [Lactococcus garvieae]UYT12272.1 helix-turn-helix domain-containing protein [Lactococcus garvieae]